MVLKKKKNYFLNFVIYLFNFFRDLGDINIELQLNKSTINTLIISLKINNYEIRKAIYKVYYYWLQIYIN